MEKNLNVAFGSVEIIQEKEEQTKKEVGLTLLLSVQFSRIGPNITSIPSMMTSFSIGSWTVQCGGGEAIIVVFLPGATNL